MNILLLTSSMSSGGAERVAATLANAWSGRGGRVTLMPTFSEGGGCFYTLSPQVRLVYLADLVPAKARTVINQMLRLRALRRFIDRERPDVIVSFLPNVNVAAILASAFLRIPLIICERSDPSSFPKQGFLDKLCQATYRFADMLTVQTTSVAAKVDRLFPGVKSVRVIPNPLPTDVVSIAKAASGHRKVLLSLGRLSSEKQIDRLLDAFSAVATMFEGWDLHIYGDGPQQAALALQIEVGGLQQRVFLKGRTHTPWSVMANAEAFAMTSRYEGFPNALLEAMGVGLPCVVFDCPSGPRDITRDGEDALLVPLNDHDGLVAALTTLMGDETRRHALGRQARESVCRRFSLGEVIEQWDRLFVEVGALR
ncbi:MAG: glycosyltransferase family 4 protein [Herminiimonas sp.]|nr:glycosyltransferase family 4 protein [Herminiimonas sp.]